MRKILLVVGLLALCPGANADTFAAAQAHRFAADAEAFARESGRLVPALQAVCDAPATEAEAALGRARRQWLASLAAWERLSAVAIGPLLTRRSQRQIDFLPTRPRLIEKAVRAAPADAAAMERIGTPAKGLPALEWLLWVKTIQPASPACGYAVLVAEEVAREAAALAAAPQTLEPGELLNQWVGGIERLRWSNLEMPARVALTSEGRQAPEFPRRASGATAASWAAQWATLRDWAVAGAGSLESALRARGQDETAVALARAVEQTDVAMRGLDTEDTGRLLTAAEALADLKRLVEYRVAPGLGGGIGFSVAAGD
jgi:predicted lipoprotein